MSHFFSLPGGKQGDRGFYISGDQELWHLSPPVSIYLHPPSPSASPTHLSIRLTQPSLISRHVLLFCLLFYSSFPHLSCYSSLILRFIFFTYFLIHYFVFYLFSPFFLVYSVSFLFLSFSLPLFFFRNFIIFSDLVLLHFLFLHIFFALFRPGYCVFAFNSVILISSL